ncbi:hypothetical protein Y032_0034g2934 [Ancylostoma ceylanicum]|uniref:Uncharacterized protein n=1 Tax=Ancylostoma ceylanicum TaxID=53326 RepID=A0A016UPB6_9BILA|nr:hypothetical protein Y032_0034g2934 [Ancylostoma ceylanicum]
MRSNTMWIIESSMILRRATRTFKNIITGLNFLSRRGAVRVDILTRSTANYSLMMWNAMTGGRDWRRTAAGRRGRRLGVECGTTAARVDGRRLELWTS